MIHTAKQALEAAANTDRELWRERPDDYYANSIHVTEQGGIGINVGGTVIVKRLADWHALAAIPLHEPEPVEAIDVALRSALRFAGSRSAITADQEKEILALWNTRCAAQAPNALVEALTPSGDTKAAYMGEFKFTTYACDEDGEEQPQQVYVSVGPTLCAPPSTRNSDNEWTEIVPLVCKR